MVCLYSDVQIVVGIADIVQYVSAYTLITDAFVYMIWNMIYDQYYPP